MAGVDVNVLMDGSRDEPNDCAYVAMSVYLGIPYNEIVRAATVLDRKQGRAGLWRKTMIRIADALGYTLKLKRRFDLSEEYAIFMTPDHAAILRSGLILDRLSVWDAEDYLRAEKLRVSDCELLISVD